ncbi:hypothetical protein A3A71_02715 [Candidatus Berkelbacteria bacterium RIFCSPLOWO2_01_FULL_50_28]|uniref:Uncharacterized protein n=1 Tax=Candidatus Berkelbacteria bacterium RIFCSPLOWO2_01_FULL_50_28 TaxID=1797471 RepID=A0A1F5ECK0_9BACT|nr:MAG: hypothetical protein A2807_02205 [Candidatus Berkelbacteria bacterium RIFCSPHIGHO2_01_FULL_50_36]OGD62622.1 MAG: hypothetical protein A3F39_02795 [Candidatus Berkelbacteria bacterium RIFCSPHIGHO2_12_FULL_50_11]OGD64934.1 MAG: hypothetical protein A3A71_02715 [Candidatus Berkelbacteria bacterium RIFCSPLOWO2_01_FULL_50_28]
MKKVFIYVSSRVLAGLLLGIAGLALTLSSPASNPQGTNAADTDSYNTKWTATKLITVCCWDYRGASLTTNTHEIAIGVSAWHVEGKLNDELAFTEDWKAPAVGAKVTRYNATSTHSPWPSNSGFNPTKWLLATYHTIGVGADDRANGAGRNATVFAEKTPGEINYAIPSQNNSGYPILSGNGAQTCTRDNTRSFRCRISTGSYGWLDNIGDKGANLGQQEIMGGGLFMPLEWTVTGTLY